MEGQEEVLGSNGHTQIIIKGKRSKRQRPLSPFDVALTSSSSTGCGGGRAGSEDGSISSSSAPPSMNSDDVEAVYESTEEEEDMANCLILLAKGGDAPKQEENFKMERMERMATTNTTTTTTKGGFYIYECKTCNRTFPSFQALGGHRASHKKPKAMMEEKKVPTILEYLEEAQINITPPPKHVQISGSSSSNNKGNFHGNNKTNKIHECSICGLEFMSGQALGGHMRRHRTASTISTQVVMSVEATTTTTMDSKHVEIKPASRNILSLDLNLPAPEDDSKFQFTSPQPQQSLVFSASALVDCHY
uniref:C2H2-type domain-containing protein n=1 Tax=Fagus sylvatica TaxID=28930 RepID=A0A2N9ELP0_FAGSY